LSLGGGTKEVRKILEDCRNDTSTVAPKLLSEAKTGLKTGDYDKAAKSIEYASIPHSCGLKQPSVEFEFLQLFSQISIYTQLSDAAMRIIDRF